MSLESETYETFCKPQFQAIDNKLVRILLVLDGNGKPGLKTEMVVMKNEIGEVKKDLENMQHTRAKWIRGVVMPTVSAVLTAVIVTFILRSTI
jgi:hypothetical protein